MFADYMKKLEKSKCDIHSIIGKNNRSKSLGFSSARKSTSRKSTSRKSTSRSKSLGFSSGLGRGRRTRTSGRSGRARGNSDENQRISNMCSICLDNLDNGQPITSHDAGEGRHSYHVECIVNWWQARPNDRNTCAECKRRIPANGWMTDGQPTVFPREEQRVIATVPENVHFISDRRLYELAEFVIEHERLLYLRMNQADRRLYGLLINQERNTEVGERFQQAINYYIALRNIDQNERARARAPYFVLTVFVLFIIFINNVDDLVNQCRQSRR